MAALLTAAEYAARAGRLVFPTQAFINGEFVPAVSGETFATTNPATGAGCSLSSSFGALMLAAFFGLLGLLAPSRAALLTFFFIPRPVRYLWPSANPRASPSLV